MPKQSTIGRTAACGLEKKKKKKKQVRQKRLPAHTSVAAASARLPACLPPPVDSMTKFTATGSKTFCFSGFVEWFGWVRMMTEEPEDEYVPGLAGSEESPMSKKNRLLLKKRETPSAAAGPVAPPPDKKKSRAREMSEIAAGKGQVEKRATKDGVKALVDEEKKEEDEEDDEGEVVVYEMDDAAVGRQILKRERKEALKNGAEKKMAKRNASNPRKKPSVAHVMFEATTDPNAFRCRLSSLPCEQSHPSLVKRTGGTTSNLISHARTYHGDILNALIKASNDCRDLASEFDGLLAAATPPTTAKKDLTAHFNKVARSKDGFEAQLALLIMLVRESIPFSLIDSQSFKDWMTVLGYTLQSEGSIKKMLPPLYEAVMHEQAEFVRKSGFFSITFDMWTSIAKQKYLVATFHTLSENFVMFSAPLDLIPMSCSAYGEFIAVAIQSRIAVRFADCVFMASFSDSGSNCRLAKGLLTPGDEEPCFNHTMKLMLDDVIGGAEGGHVAANAVAALDLLSVGLLVAIVRPNTQLRSEVSSACGKVGIENLELIAANITRWEGRYSALKRFLELRAALCKVHAKGIFLPFMKQAEKSFPKDFLTEDFFRRLAGYQDLLKRFHAISKAAQSQTEPTLSCVAHWVWSMEAMLKSSESDSGIIKKLKEDLMRSSKKRMSVFVAIEVDASDEVSVMPNAVKAGLLDPRHSHEVQDRLTKKELVAVKDAIIADTLHLWTKEALHGAIEAAMQGAFESLMEKLKEASSYGGSPLTWWCHLKNCGEEADVFKPFFRSARVFLSMPAGGAPPESVFSATTDMVTKKRNCLGDDTLEQMTIVRHYLRSPQYKFDDLAKKMAADVAKIKKREAENKGKGGM